MSGAGSVWQKLGLHWSSVRGAWAVRNVRRGFHGTLLIALGSLTPAYLPRSSALMGPLRAAHLTGAPFRLLGTVAVLAGLALLVDAWFRLRPSDAGGTPVAWRDLKHWAVLGIWGAPFLLAPPIFSHDAYSYAAQGWMVHNGTNPYQAGPGTLPGGFADQVAWVWRFTPAPYGPLSLQIQHGLVHLAGYDPFISSLLMRVPALLGVVLIGLLVPRIAVRLGIDPAQAAWFATLSPVLVIDFIGGAHNDALMVGLVVLALWLAYQGKWWWLASAVIVGVAATIKQPAILAAYALPLIARPWVGWHWREVLTVFARAVASFALALGAFAAITAMTGLGYGWLNAVGVPGLVVTVSPSTIIGQGLQFVLNLFGLDSTGHMAVRTVRQIGLGVSGIGIAAMALTIARRRPITFLSWSYLLFALASPALHSWYVLWGGVLLPLTKPSNKMVRAAVWATVILLSYAAINLAWRNSVSATQGNNGALALGVAAVAGYAWQVHTHDRSTEARRRHRRGDKK